MITKIHHSSDVSKVLDTAFAGKEMPKIVDTSCLNIDRMLIQAELEDAIGLRSEIKKPIFHAILSVPSSDEVAVEQWQSICTEYMERMGFECALYLAILHTEESNHHVHIVASRIDAQGKLVNDSFEMYRSQEVARELEAKHELTKVLSSWESANRAPSGPEYHHVKRSGEVSTRKLMCQAIGTSLEASGGVAEFLDALTEKGINLVARRSREGHIQGVYFEHNGWRFAGSKVSRSYSWPRLSKRLGYDHERDAEMLTYVTPDVVAGS